MSVLEELSQRYSTDKSHHAHYLENYEAWLSPLRDSPISLLELGIRDGGSLQVWRDYFPKGQIAGLDILPTSVDDASGRIHVFQGEQQDKNVLDEIAQSVAPDGFDVIIDDCSHIARFTRQSFQHLFEHRLKPGGFYIIEDWGPATGTRGLTEPRL